jgi:hypothetical protein
MGRSTLVRGKCRRRGPSFTPRPFERVALAPPSRRGLPVERCRRSRRARAGPRGCGIRGQVACGAWQGGRKMSTLPHPLWIRAQCLIVTWSDASNRLIPGSASPTRGEHTAVRGTGWAMRWRRAAPWLRAPRGGRWGCPQRSNPGDRLSLCRSHIGSPVVIPDLRAQAPPDVRAGLPARRPQRTGS